MNSLSFFFEIVFWCCINFSVSEEINNKPSRYFCELITERLQCGSTFLGTWHNPLHSAGELNHFIDFFQRETSLSWIAAEQKYRTCKQPNNCALIWSHTHHPDLEIKGDMCKNVKNGSTLPYQKTLETVFSVSLLGAHHKRDTKILLVVQNFDIALKKAV